MECYGGLKWQETRKSGRMARWVPARRHVPHGAGRYAHRDAIRAYRAAIRSADRAGFVGQVANEQVGAFALTCCHEDDRVGRDIACAAARWYNGDNDTWLNPVRFATAGGVEAVVAKFRSRSNEQLIEDGM